ncbi:tartronate semialdehyde reductase [Cohnella faecalis]|uniref:Tartronate semialdehyde reductase n=2 Tax=Cohnella faecalis TaxID=2315694 RepID=A0A398CK89_9BACL|nr:tartronate semialdehyde reductase [Cohnella faecalis]
MNTIGFIGLGVMGGPMAANLLRKGYAVTVYNRTPGRTEELEKLGADVAASIPETVRSADVVISMISNDQAIEQIYYGENGVLAALKPGTTVIDSSTISPALARRLANDVAAQFCDFMDAPVTGSKPAAIEGTLLFMVGGSKTTVAAHRELLLAMGKEVIHVGDSGSGAVAKVAHNTIVGINAAGLIEGMAIAAKGGLDASSFLRIVQSGGAASKQADLKGNKIIDHDFSVQFSLDLMLKDLKLSAALTDGLGVSTPMLEAAKSLFQIGQASGYGELDLAALARVYEEWIGMRIGNVAAAPSSSAEEELAAASSAAEYISEKERRKKARLSLEIPVMLSIYQWLQEGSFSGQSLPGYIRDVSEDGLQISSASPLEKDMFVIVHLPPEAGLPPMTARIIRIEKENGMFKYGCLLTALSLYQRIQLKEYIDSKLPD